MPQAFYVLFGAAFTVAVSVALGRLILRHAGAPLDRMEEPAVAFVTGSACLSAIVFALAAVRVVYKGVFLAVGVAILLAAWRRRLHRRIGAPAVPLPRFWRVLCWLVFAVFGSLCFLHAMAPEMSPDGSAYHLGLVSRYYREHGFRIITTNMYANLSQGVELLFLFAYAFGRHSSAALVHFAFLAALPVAMMGYARRFGFPVAGAAGALLVFASPVVGIDGSSAYNDVAVSAILFVLYYLLQIWDRSRLPGLLVPIGLLAGFAYAAKYTAFLAVPYALGFVGWKLIRGRQRWFGPLVRVALLAGLMMAPWMTKNWIALRNPVSPFFNQTFPNPFVHVSFEQEYGQHMRNYPGLKSRWEIPLEVTTRGNVLCGLLGPVFLLSPVALLALRFPHGRRLLLAGLFFGITYLANIGTRFLIPPLPYLALAMALSLSNARGMTGLLVLVHAISAWPPVLSRYCDQYAWRLDRYFMRQALRLETEDGFLQRRWPPYAVARMIEKHVAPGGKVLTYNQTGEAYTSREVLVVYQAASNGVLGEILWMPLIAEYPPTRRLEFRFPAQELRKVRAVQTAAGAPDHWSIAEFRVFDGGRELPREAGWRLTAQPNPWEVQLAFDNSPVTRWKCWHPLQAGMFVEVDFGAPARVDRVALDSSRDQYKTRLRLEGADASGAWRTLATDPVETELARPLGLRRATALELKFRGASYLLVHESDFGAEDYRARSEEWGFTELGESWGFRLYRID